MLVNLLNCFTVKKLAKPPHLIMRIMDCVLILFQKRVDPVTMDPERPCVKPSWSEALKLMSGGGFLPGLMNFPKVIACYSSLLPMAPSQLFTKRQNFQPVQIENICKRQNECNLNTEILFEKGEKHCGEKEEMLVTSIFSFPHNVFKSVLFQGC